AVRAAHAASGGGLCVGVPGSWERAVLCGRGGCQGHIDDRQRRQSRLRGICKPHSERQQGVHYSEAPAKKDDGAWALIGRWTDSGSGKDGVEIRETMPVERGYSYQVVMTGTVRDAAGKVLDNISEKSSVRRY
ncbi:MAG: hypothetical protein VB115_09860, partial [Christensenellaceae bacterium]|nr:hypothetical protein [Christensenellaceae bacterium]